MNYDVKFAENVTIESLNPHNFALKNEYIDNLLSTAWLLIPAIGREYGDLKIIRGFMSEAYMRSQNYRVENAPHIAQHAQGLALEVTWTMFNTDDAINTGLDLINTSLEPLYVIVDPERKKICMYRRYLKDTSTLSQIVDGSLRVIKNVSIEL